MSAADLSESFPCRGVIRLEGRSLFEGAGTPTCRRLLERVRHAHEITEVRLVEGESPRAELYYCPKSSKREDVVRRIAALLREGSGNGEPATNGRGRAFTPLVSDGNGIVRYFRHESLMTRWKIALDRPGRIRLKNRLLFRRSSLCQAVERELMGVLGIDRYRTSSLTCTVLVDYDPTQLDKLQLIEILDSAISSADRPAGLDKLDLHLPICTALLPIAATAQFAAPALLPATAAVFVCTSIPLFRETYRVVVRERRLGVEVLDSIVVIGCLGTMAIFPGAVLGWCVSFGRVLVKRTQENSRRILLSAFGKQPRYAWLYREGTEVQVPLDRIEKRDLVVVNAGEVVPVDGHIVEGMAMIDQLTLTGEPTPAKKGVGERIFAATLMVAGKIFVSVETVGRETASARISRLLHDTAGYTFSSRPKGERLADRAVIPTLALGAIGMATVGPAGAVAVLKSDLGTSIHMSAPLAMLGSLVLCAYKGILVTDGRALERMNEVDTVVLDQAALMNRECCEVGRIIASGGLAPERVLQLAAAAERKFHHPIARAILHRARELGLSLPPANDCGYKVGHGISVRVEGHTVCVGSRCFLESEGIELAPRVGDALEVAHREGDTMVMVGVDGHLAGAIELRAQVRPDVRAIIEGLRQRGIKHIAIISGDHEAPTRTLAESLGIDQSFARVLPADRAGYVRKLQDEGGKVCFVGDGTSESIAMKTSNVSISLRGASSIATDAAQIVIFEDGLSKLCELCDIARQLDRNVKRSWSMILAPNIACVAGVFTMGFGIMASVATSNIAALAAVVNGMLPLRTAAQLEAERRHHVETCSAIARQWAAGPHWHHGHPGSRIAPSHPSLIASMASKTGA